MPRVYRPAQPPSPAPTSRASTARVPPGRDPFEFDEEPHTVVATTKPRPYIGTSIDDEAMSSAKVFRLYLKLAEIKSGTLCAKYTYHDIRRFFSVASDDDVHEITVRDDGPDDPLASLLSEGLRDLPKNDHGAASNDDVELVASLAVIIEPDLKRYKPMAWIAYDLGSAHSTQICGALTACSFVSDVSFQTQQLSDAYNRRNKLPAFDEDWTLIDVVSSSKKGTATILLLHAYLAAVRAKKQGLVAIAVTASGKKLFESLGFRNHRREVFWLGTEELTMERVHRRLKLDNALVTKVCWRHGLTSRTAANVLGRC